MLKDIIDMNSELNEDDETILLNRPGLLQRDAERYFPFSLELLRLKRRCLNINPDKRPTPWHIYELASQELTSARIIAQLRTPQALVLVNKEDQERYKNGTAFQHLPWRGE